MRRGRRGFTFVELMVVILLISILTGLAVMHYINLKHRALSARATADLESIRLAAYNEMYTSGNWPAEQPPGILPPELVAQLGSGFQFARSEYTIDWENLGSGGGGMQVGVTITSTNPRLMHVLSQTVANKGPFVMVGNELTMVIVGPDGQS